MIRSEILFSAGHGISPRGFWYSWVEEPLLIIAVYVAVSVYVIGLRRLHREAPKYHFPKWRIISYFGGVLAFCIALLSPLAAYSEELFAMHMVQHLLLLIVAPPLILLGTPLIPALWTLPTEYRKRFAKLLRPGQPLGRMANILAYPMLAVAAYVICVAVWHVPNFYDAAQGRTFMHDLEHVMFYGTALLYWWPIVAPIGSNRRLKFGMAIPYLLPPFLEGMLIGALITFSDTPIYQTYQELDVNPIWGMGTLDDQQLGGLIMWVPGGMFFLIPLIGTLALLLRENERKNPIQGRSRISNRGSAQSKSPILED